MNRPPVVISLTLLFWAGFVSSISFMEAWLKFQAPGVTLPVGLGIGKLVFTALNRTEWVFFVFLVFLIAPRYKKFTRKFLYLFLTVLLLLGIQTIWLLPELTNRAELIIEGMSPEKSNVHLLFGIAEISKVVLLIYLGYFLIRLKKSSIT